MYNAVVKAIDSLLSAHALTRAQERCGGRCTRLWLIVVVDARSVNTRLGGRQHRRYWLAGPTGLLGESWGPAVAGSITCEPNKLLD